MSNRSHLRRTAAFCALAAIPASWWLTVTPWPGEVGGLYSFGRTVFNLAVTAIGLALAYVLLGRQPWKPKAQSATLSLVSIGFCLLMLEIPGFLLGIDNRDLFGRPHDNTAQHLSHGVNKPDPVLIHIHWPDSAFAGEVAGNLASLGVPRPTRYKVDVHYDHNGFRNDRDFERAEIAVIGDSFVEAAIVPREKSLTARIEARLNVPTVNLGQIAYGLRQELEVLKRYALPLSPRIVIWALFGGNDLRDVPNYEAALRGDKPPPPTLKERLFLRNALVAGGGFLQGLWSGVRWYPTEKALNRSALFKRADGVTERVYFGATETPYSPHEWQVTVETLREANRLSTASGARLLVVYIPRKFRIYREYLTMAPGTEIATWTLNDLPGALGKWCADNGVDFLDLTPRLAPLVAEGRHPYFIDDVHWNPLGHETAAAAIVKHLSDKGLIPLPVAGQ